MRKTLLAAAVVSAVGAASNAVAEEAASPHTVTGNVGLFSSYRFRGIDQTFGKPALQGGFDYSHSSGLYAGNWNSNVNSGAGYPDGNLEMDFYAGWKKTWGDWGLDVGAIYYYYPNAEAPGIGDIDNTEVYIAGSWKFISLKYSHAVSDYFGAPDSKNSYYIDLSANYDLGNGWGVNGHVGQLKFKNYSNGDYTDWKIGVTKDVGGYVFGLSYVDTDANGDCNKGEFYCFTDSLSNDGARGLNVGSKTKDAGRGIAVVSISKTF